MKLTTINTMAFATALLIVTAGHAQPNVHDYTGTVMAADLDQGEGAGLGAGAQGTSTAVKDDLFAGTEIFEKNATGVTEISMDPDSLNMVSGKDKDKAHNMVLNVVRTYEYDKPGMYNMADVDKFREKLNTGDWHCSVHQRNFKTGESTDVCSKHRTDDLHETAIITVEPKELTFIHTISHHPTMMGMPGMGEMGMFPGGIASLKSLAMLDPEILEMQIQLNSLKPGMGLHLAPLAPGLMILPKIDGEEFGKAFEKNAQDWEKLGMKMKEFDSPDGKKTIIVTPEAEPAPPAPHAAPSPQVAPQPAPNPQMQ